MDLVLEGTLRQGASSYVLLSYSELNEEFLPLLGGLNVSSNRE